MKKYQSYSLLFVFSFFLINCNVSVNKTIRIDDGETVRRSLNSVNGNVIIGDDCVIRDDCRSVNGRVEIGRNSETRDLESVNGQVEIAKNVKINGDVSCINGSVTCDNGVKIDGEIYSINGSIDISKTEVEDNIETYNGNITLRSESIVHGDIIIKRNKGKSDRRRQLKIRIMQDSVVEGDIIVRDKRIDVDVYLSRGGKVNGKIENAEVIRE